MKKPVLVIVLAAVVVAAAAVGFMKFGQGGGPQAKAGECVALANRKGDHADVSGAGCGTDAKFKVGKVLAEATNSCPANDDDYVQVVPNAGGGKLCLLPNLAEGACYRPADDEDSWLKSDCKGDETIKVTKVLASAGTESECPDGEDSASIVYLEPPTTYCLALVQKSTAEPSGT